MWPGCWRVLSVFLLQGTIVLCLRIHDIRKKTREENLFGYGVQKQWPWPGRSLDMVELTPIHGQLVLLV
jgi:hypothetical protein